MVDIETIKENYRRMSDEQLTRFAKLEAENLSLDAFHALKNELSSRNIDLDVIEQYEDIDVPDKAANNAITGLFVDKLFEFMLDEKVNGSSNTEIYHGLIGKKINSEQAFMLIEMFQGVCQKAKRNIETEILVAWVFLFIGILLCLFFFTPLDFKFFIGAFIILAAAVKLANSYQLKNKINTALEKCKEESDSSIKNLYQ